MGRLTEESRERTQSFLLAPSATNARCLPSGDNTNRVTSPLVKNGSGGSMANRITGAGVGGGRKPMLMPTKISTTMSAAPHIYQLARLGRDGPSLPAPSDSGCD